MGSFHVLSERTLDDLDRLRRPAAVLPEIAIKKIGVGGVQTLIKELKLPGPKPQPGPRKDG